MTDDNKKPKVSVVCAWYNRAEYISQTLDSLLQQDLDDYEIIIANDGSPDPRVREILDSYDDSRLKVIHKQNEGFTRTIKMLIDLAKAPFVAIQGAGDVSYSNRLSTQYQFLVEHLNAGVVSSGFDVEIEGGSNLRYSKPRTIRDSQDLKNGVPSTHGTMMYRKEVYYKSGGYDVRFKYCSDWDLYFRMLPLCEIRCIQKPLYKKIEFNDGFSFSPIHKFSQVLHRETVVYQKNDREKLVESLGSRSNEIKPYNHFYLRMSARYAASFLKKKDHNKAYLWSRFFLKSLLSYYKNYTSR